MKFRTEIVPRPLARPIRLGEKLLSVGSCFSEHIARRLSELKFDLTANPTGVLFNPLSIASALEDWAAGRQLTPNELELGSEGLWFHYAMHGSLSAPERDKACEAMNRALKRGGEALERADHLLITFGTARVYERLDGAEIVANCHKQPAHLFRSRNLSIQEIVARWSRLIEAGPLRQKSIILTLSPIRHAGDGAEQNSLSKALLRVAIAELEERFSQVHYFPAWELMMDDLRDYRFYGEDLRHPSQEAVRYIWERFSEAALDGSVQALQPRLEALSNALNHRPLHPESEAYKAFCLRSLEEITALERLAPLDFEKEKAFFKGQIGSRFQ